MKKLAVLNLVILLSFGCFANDLPDKVALALQAYGGVAYMDSYDEYEEDGVMYYNIIIVHGMEEIEVLIDQNGNIIEVIQNEGLQDDDFEVIEEEEE